MMKTRSTQAPWAVAFQHPSIACQRCLCLMAALLLLFQSSQMGALAAPALPAEPGGSDAASPEPQPATAGAHSYAGTFKSPEMTVQLKSEGTGYTGTIQFKGDTFPLTAREENGQLQGTFKGKDDYFDITAKLDGHVLSLTSGDTTYTLHKQGGNPLEKPKPVNPLAKTGSSSLTSRALSDVASKVKSHLKRENLDTILAPGDPPLTYGSVAAFANVISYCMDMDLTETEFESIRQTAIATYKNGSAETKNTLATTAQELMQQFKTGSDEERAAKKERSKQYLEDFFSKGAQAGVPWCVTIQAAIDRRSHSLKTVDKDEPAALRRVGMKKDFTEADLDASLEMLYFMWVASGRDPSLVTPQSVAVVRAALVQNFAVLPADLQYMFANAQKCYSTIRAVWAKASPQQQLRLAQQYGQILDALGLKVPQAGGGSGASGGHRSGGAWSDWEGKSSSEIAAETVVSVVGANTHTSW